MSVLLGTVMAFTKETRVSGTFDFGRQVLRMTSITGECCAYGRDQLVYHLEFTELERLMNDAMRVLAPGSTLMIVPDSRMLPVVTEHPVMP